MCELMLVYHTLHDLTVSDLLHGAVLAGVDVEPVQVALVYTSPRAQTKRVIKGVPVGLVVHGRHVAFFDYPVLLGEVGFGECLSQSAMFTCLKQAI